MQPSEINAMMNLEEAKFVPFTPSFGKMYSAFYDRPTLPLADKIMQRVSEDEIDIPPTMSVEMKDFILRKRANGLPESYIREQLKEQFNITEIK